MGAPDRGAGAQRVAPVRTQLVARVSAADIHLPSDSGSS